MVMVVIAQTRDASCPLRTCVEGAAPQCNCTHRFVRDNGPIPHPTGFGRARSGTIVRCAGVASAAARGRRLRVRGCSPCRQVSCRHRFRVAAGSS